MEMFNLLSNETESRLQSSSDCLSTSFHSAAIPVINPLKYYLPIMGITLK